MKPGVAGEEAILPMTVSVVVPSYNVEAYLAAAVRSCLEQDRPPDQIVVIDDGSTDGTAAIAESFGDRVELVRQSNRGLAATRNVGARLATGDSLLFLDADDRLHPSAIAILLEKLSSDPSVGVVVPNFNRVFEDGSSVEAWRRGSIPDVLRRKDLIGLIRANWLAANALVRKVAWERYPFREDLRSIEDLDFWLQILLNGYGIGLVEQPLVDTRIGRTGSLSKQLYTMRRYRRLVFESLASDPRLTPKERVLLRYQVARSTLGQVAAAMNSELEVQTAKEVRASDNRMTRVVGNAAIRWPRLAKLATSINERRAERPSGNPATTIQVCLDEAGGGSAQARELTGALRSWMRAELVEIHPDVLNGSPWSFVRAVKRIAAATPANNSVIHAHGIRVAGPAGFAARRAKAPLVVTVHGLHAIHRNRGMLQRAAVSWTRFSLRRADAILTIGDSDRELIEEHRLGGRAQIVPVRTAFTVPDLADRATARRELDVPDGSIVCVWLGRLHEQKDPLTFVNAVRLLAHRDDVVALMVGDGPLMDDVQEATSRLGPHCDLRLFGWRDDVGSFLAAADIFVSTARWEGLPLACLEAAASGLPLVLTDCPGNRDLVARGVPASVVPVASPDVLARELEDLLEDETGRAAMAVRAKDIVLETYTMDNLVSEVVAAYRTRIAVGRGPAPDRLSEEAS